MTEDRRVSSNPSITWASPKPSIPAPHNDGSKLQPSAVTATPIPATIQLVVCEPSAIVCYTSVFIISFNKKNIPTIIYSYFSWNLILIIYGQTTGGIKVKLEIINYFPKKIIDLLNNLSKDSWDKIVEIRLRVNQPVQILTEDGEMVLNKVKEKEDNTIIIKNEDIKEAFRIITANSVYALERQLAEGFITIPGGHRVGFAGQIVMKNGIIKTIKNISSINYRLTHEKIGVAASLLPLLCDKINDLIYNTLIISPPLCGKTTFLRDLVRLISQGQSRLKISGKKVGLVDERSEIAGAYNGIPQNRIGSRTDLLDNCPKSAGIILLIRSMSPEVLAVDEIGTEEDVKAVMDAANSGVSIITTIHGTDFSSVKNKPGIANLIERNIFQRYVIMSKRKGLGTIETVIDNDGREVKNL